jgi:hypothetical protein
MYRYFFRFVVTTVTILAANLLTSAIGDFMVSYKNQYKPVVFTFLGMGITVVIFYPLFLKLDDWVKYISVKAIKSGKSMGGKYVGLFLMFLIAMLILFYFYAKMWYHIDFMKILMNGTLRNYF